MVELLTLVWIIFMAGAVIHDFKTKNRLDSYVAGKKYELPDKSLLIHRVVKSGEGTVIVCRVKYNKEEYTNVLISYTLKDFDNMIIKG